MPDFKATMQVNNAFPEVRAKALARVYQFLLSLPGSTGSVTEAPVVDSTDSLMEVAH